MTTDSAFLAIALAAVLGTVALVILTRAARTRRLRGFESGVTFFLDDRTLFSERLMLVGRPDRIVHRGRLLIPEEWKASRRVYPAHRLRLAVSFLLIEDRFGVRPPPATSSSPTALACESRTPSSSAPKPSPSLNR